MHDCGGFDRANGRAGEDGWLTMAVAHYGPTESICGRLEHLRSAAPPRASATSPTTSPDLCSKPANSGPGYTFNSMSPLSHTEPLEGTSPSSIHAVGREPSSAGPSAQPSAPRRTGWPANQSCHWRWRCTNETPACMDAEGPCPPDASGNPYSYERAWRYLSSPTVSRTFCAPSPSIHKMMSNTRSNERWVFPDASRIARLRLPRAAVLRGSPHPSNPG